MEENQIFKDGWGRQSIRAILDWSKKEKKRSSGCKIRSDRQIKDRDISQLGQQFDQLEKDKVNNQDGRDINQFV